MNYEKPSRKNINEWDKLIYQTDEGLVHIMEIIELRDSGVTARGYDNGRLFDAPKKYTRAVIVNRDGEIYVGKNANSDLEDIAIGISDSIKSKKNGNNK